jgi:predicted HAD superfamily Cof-like phosphohydrolase
MSMYLDVVAFTNACDQKPSEENSELYIKLINEEYNEFIDAYANDDEVEMLDACMDSIWVILAFCHMKGYDVHGAWNEVLRTNMSKVDPNTGKVKRRSDGKILKPEGWQEPDLSKFI